MILKIGLELEVYTCFRLGWRKEREGWAGWLDLKKGRQTPPLCNSKTVNARMAPTCGERTERERNAHWRHLKQVCAR